MGVDRDGTFEFERATQREKGMKKEMVECRKSLSEAVVSTAA
jgi:hypothetical protein